MNINDQTYGSVFRRESETFDVDYQTMKPRRYIAVVG